MIWVTVLGEILEGDLGRRWGGGGDLERHYLEDFLGLQYDDWQFVEYR